MTMHFAEASITIPIEGDRPFPSRNNVKPQHAVAVNVVSLALSEAENAMCEKLHVAPADFLKSKARYPRMSNTSRESLHKYFGLV
jgi:hypothetical protein